MQGGSAVEEHGMFADDILEDVPHDGFLLLDHFLGLLDGSAVTLGFELVIDEGLEELEGHLLGQTTLIELELGADDDNGASGIVHALAEEVLAEAALLALEGIAEGLERTIVGAAKNAATAAVIKERVHGFLEHALFVADDDIRRAKFHELLQPVVAVDDAAIEVVEIGGGEAAAIERHKRTQFGREDGDDIENHPLGLVAALAEGFENLEALGVLDALLERRIGLHFLAEFVREFLDFDAAQKFLDGFRAHLGDELARKFGGELAEFFLLKDLALLEDGHFAGVHDNERLEVENALEIAHGNVQEIANAAGKALEEPDVGAGRSQLNVAEAFTTDLAERHFDAALVADHTTVLHPLILAAQAFPIGDGAEDFCAEQAVTLRLKGAVVDGLRLGDFAVGPGTDFFRTGEADPDGIKIRNQTRTIVRAAAIQGRFLPPRLSPGTRSDGAGPAENPTTETFYSRAMRAKRGADYRARTAEISLPLFPPAASDASSTRRRGRATATRERAR